MKSLDTPGWVAVGIALAVVSSCAARTLGDGAVIQTEPGSTIASLDGEEVYKRRAVVSPGDHAVRFETRTKLLLFQPRCSVKLRLKPGVSYTFSTELEETRLPPGALGVRWRKLEATGFLSVKDPAKETRRLALPCTDCITFRSNNAGEKAVSCHRYRALVRIEELCRARSGDHERCVRDGETLVLAWRSSPDDWVLFVPGLDADYSSEEHLDAFYACIKSETPDAEACLTARGWEAVP